MLSCKWWHNNIFFYRFYILFLKSSEVRPFLTYYVQVYIFLLCLRNKMKIKKKSWFFFPVLCVKNVSKMSILGVFISAYP